ncbi:helix-turn-helix transcriptional regulator [Streptomyces sp. HD1123-B1]|uniref:helix-turn-helix domain-containing protein n=1 Tax=Streptomyces huangiella TaxID=3228804 RepID=UPI003D7C826B
MKPFERLDQAMSGRRLQLRMNWRQVSEAAGISYTALRAIRRGDYRPTELTARGLDEALHWAPGSVGTILEGGEPTPAEAEDAPLATRAPYPEGEKKPRVTSTLSEELELARRLLLATVRELGLSPEEADEAWRQVRLDIEQSHMPAQEDRPGRNERSFRAG